MAELLLTIRPADRGRDGDIAVAVNDNDILRQHAWIICRPQNFGFTHDGLRPADLLMHQWYSITHPHKFERVSENIVKRTVLKTQEVEYFPTSDDSLGVRTSGKDHRVFGAPGRELWFGGTPDYSKAVLDLLWTEIEKRSKYRKADARRWMFTEWEKKRKLMLAVDDFDIETKDDLMAPLVDEKGEVLKRHKYKVIWRDLPGLSAGTEADVTNPNVIVDIREAVIFQRSQIVVVKEAE